MGMEKPEAPGERFLADGIVKPYWSMVAKQLPKWFLMVATKRGWIETRRYSVRLTQLGLEIRNRVMRERAERAERERKP